MERENVFGGNGRERSPIVGWETVRVFYDRTVSVQGEDDRGNIRVTVEVQRPQFEDGGSGRPTLSVVVARGERVLRLPCRDGSFGGVEALAKLLGEVLNPERVLSIHSEFSQILETSRPPRRDSTETQGRPGKPGDPGMGLGRFSMPGKTERRRRRDEKGSKDRRGRAED